MFARIFFAVVTSLALVPTPALAQTSSTSPCQAVASTMELFKYGNQWLQWTELEREIYLIGLVDGGMVYIDFVFKQPEQVRKEILEQNSVMYYNDVLAPVMTSLYRDPSNIYIRYNSMVFIARDKVAGRDVEPMLRMARQKDCGGDPKR